MEKMQYHLEKHVYLNTRVHSGYRTNNVYFITGAKSDYLYISL